MPGRRRFLQVCTTGVAGFVAGCFSGPAGDESETPTASETPTQSPTPTAGDGVLYAEEWTDVTIEKGGGWIIELPAFETASDLAYAVSTEAPVNFDVYVFADDYTKETYERWINAPSDMKFETSGIVGISGATARDVSESIERTAFVDAGQMWIVVDYSDFNGGFPRAEVDGDSPDEISVDASVRVTSAF